MREKKKSTAKTARDERREAAARTEALARGYHLEEASAASTLEEASARRVMEDAAHQATASALSAEQAELGEVARKLRGDTEEELARKKVALERMREKRQANAEELARLRARFEAQLKREAEEKLALEEEARLERMRREEAERRRRAATALQRVLVPAFLLVDERMPKKKGKKGKKKK